MKKEDNHEKKKEHHDCTKEYRELKEEYDALVSENKEILKELAKAKQGEKDATELAKNFKKDMDRMKERFAEKEKNLEAEVSVKTAKRLLSVQDNFEKSFKIVKDEQILAGFKMIYSDIENTIKELGVVKFTVNPGDEFNEETMNAIFAEPTENKDDDNKVSKVFSEGYKHVLSDKVIRYAQVSIHKI